MLRCSDLLPPPSRLQEVLFDVKEAEVLVQEKASCKVIHGCRAHSVRSPAGGVVGAV